MPSYARRRDANQSELDDAARRLGWTVYDTSQVAAFIPGWPDAVWFDYQGEVLLVEYKTADADLTEAEVEFMASLPGWSQARYEVCRSIDDVEAITRRWWPGRIG